MMIYSDSLNIMVVSGFMLYKVVFSDSGYQIFKRGHYTWNDRDCLYYSDDTDESFFNTVPKNGLRALTLKLNAKARLLVKLDK